MTEEIKLRSNRKNLTGQKFGKLTVIKPVKTINDTSRWLCKCECGNEKIVATYRLLTGRVKTCGDCFNTINFYIPKLKRLEQENKKLKKDVQLFKCLDTFGENECHCACRCLGNEFCEDADKKINTYRSALEEILESAKFAQCLPCGSGNLEDCLNCNDDTTNNGQFCMEKRIHDIKTKCVEVLN